MVVVVHVVVVVVVAVVVAEDDEGDGPGARAPASLALILDEEEDEEAACREERRTGERFSLPLPDESMPCVGKHKENVFGINSRIAEPKDVSVARN